jgi:tetratricopeptide (TPR) repeat protein
MRYLCVHCDHRFEVEAEASVPKRCPACMRATGIEPMRDEPAQASRVGARVPRSRAIWLGGAAALLLIAGGVAYALSRSSAPAARGGPAALDADELKVALAAQQVDAGPLLRLLLADAALRRFAEQAAAGKDAPRARADALFAALRARAKAAAFVPWSLSEPRATPVQTASQTLAALKDGARAELYPLELSALMVAALRALEVPALVAELPDPRGARAPLDASGYLGYFVVAVPGEAGAGAPQFQFYDVYGGKQLGPEAQATPLSDAAALGAALALRAAHENSQLSDPRAALASSSHALQLAPSLPSVRTVRGVVVLTERMVEQGLQEFQAARELRGDAARLHNLASVMLVTQELDKAQSVLSAALEKAPDFAAAHVTLATLLLLRGEAEQAHGELLKAEQLAPSLPAVHWGFAELALRRGDGEEALARARRALTPRPSFDARLRYAALLRQAGKYEEMRQTAEQLLAQAPAYRKDEVRQVLGAVLGPTALEPAAPAQADLRADDLADLGGPKLELEPPEEGARGGAGLGGPAGAGSGAGKLRLRDPSQGLQLDLGGKARAH